jgi:RNA polymerase sigma factor (sigma-70 family)
MTRSRDPLANPAPLIRRVYSYVAYRIGDGAEAEDVTSDVFERALRYRESYDESRGQPLAWLLGIARRSIDDARLRRPQVASLHESEQDHPSAEDLEGSALRRLSLASAMNRLEERDRDLLALRYGADLSARELAVLLDSKTNAVEVALHRARTRLQAQLRQDDGQEAPPRRDPQVEAGP